MKVVGLTGGIGMGKSACAEMLRSRAIPVIDTDELARQVVEPGQPALTEVQRLFGPDVVGPDGRLLRDALAARVFAEPSARVRLEQILHPRIRELWRAQVEAWRAQSLPLAVVVIPLLFETTAEKELDATICVACSAATQYQRLLARGWSPDQISLRIQAQWPIEKKISNANYVIWTEGRIELCADQLDRILSVINSRLPATLSES
jgi:dephospho-CoA kinase